METFSAESLMQGVKDRIKSTLVGLVPEEHWENLIQNEVTEFFKPKEAGYSNRVVSVSDFQVIVQRELQKICEERVRAFLNGPKFQTRWDPVSNEMVLNDELMNNLVARSPEIFARIFGNGVRDIVQNLSYSVGR